MILQLPLAVYNGPVFVPILAQDETHGTRSYDAAWQADSSRQSKTIEQHGYGSIPIDTFLVG